jgi:hypothetical protein
MVFLGQTPEMIPKTIHICLIFKSKLPHFFPLPHQHLSMKEGCLFCFVCIYERSTKQTGMLQVQFLVSLESSQGGGVHVLGFMAFGLAV